MYLKASEGRLDVYRPLLYKLKKDIENKQNTLRHISLYINLNVDRYTLTQQKGSETRMLKNRATAAYAVTNERPSFTSFHISYFAYIFTRSSETVSHQIKKVLVILQKTPSIQETKDM